MKRVTQNNLRTAFAWESRVHMRYLIFAEVAEKEGWANIARLFRAVAFAEQVHATNQYKALGRLQDSVGNLQKTIDLENMETEEVYPALKAVAELQGEPTALRVFEWALRAEQAHTGMYQQGKQAVESGRDLDIGDIYICDGCGYTMESKALELCPICGGRREEFRKF